MTSPALPPILRKMPGVKQGLSRTWPLCTFLLICCPLSQRVCPKRPIVSSPLSSASRTPFHPGPPLLQPPAWRRMSSNLSARQCQRLCDRSGTARTPPFSAALLPSFSCVVFPRVGVTPVFSCVVTTGQGGPAFAKPPYGPPPAGGPPGLWQEQCRRFQSRRTVFLAGLPSATTA